ncbi:hypothetical protein L2E82_34612 [Cichorium intybus]|uniref:Uncharacterized protein n=1 Tax=Cichorium intybus TaxID=13427 RepID=A0ACB9BMF7_CICIN|nr:hypothetical protein L2E82_34612 [Cichorium intybus]
MLRTFARFTNTALSFYDLPVRCVFADVTRTLKRALILVRKCCRRGVFLRIVSFVSVADFRKLFNFLDASIGDMKWLLSIFDSGGDSDVVLLLPPIASNDPILAWVWSERRYITGSPNHRLHHTLQLGKQSGQG